MANGRIVSNSGKLFQPQNLPRGSGLFTPSETSIDLISYCDPTILEFAYGPPLTVVSDCLRGIMVAEEGKTLMAGDYKTIEARLTASLAGHHDKIEAFRRQDDGTGHDVYKIAAGAIYGVDPGEIGDKDPRRQVGKTAELALGFGGSVNALAKMAAGYRVDFAEVWEPLREAASPHTRDKAEEAWLRASQSGNSGGLGETTWKACWLTVQSWRATNEPIVEAWHGVHEASWQAHREGKPASWFDLSFENNGGFLWMTLPSGRKIAYGAPLVENIEVPWSDKTIPKKEREHKNAVTVLASEAGKLIRYPLYPGLLFQHAVQAMARDIMANGMMNAERAGLPVVMTIHDEVIVEVAPGQADEKRFTDLLCDVPVWARNTPILASVWSGTRYRKT